jgi:hypothetical protein
MESIPRFLLFFLILAEDSEFEHPRGEDSAGF